jgi:hypothetical protein
MRLSTLFACTAWLVPIVEAEFRIIMLAPEGFQDSAWVKGKNTSEGGIQDMSREVNDNNSLGVCAGQQDNCDMKYYGVTSIWFSKPTNDPRPITVSINNTLLEVSL